MPHFHSDPELPAIRRTAAELLACVVSERFPNAYLLGGKETEVGFYYEFLFDQPFTVDMLVVIEAQVRQKIKDSIPIHSLHMMRENAAELFRHYDRPFLADQALQDLRNLVDVLQIDSSYGLTPAPHCQSTGEIGAFKLIEMKEEERLIQSDMYKVTRLVGTAFSNQQQLKYFLKAYEASKKNDHRLLGLSLNLFSVVEEKNDCSQTFWYPRGHLLCQTLKKWIEKTLGSVMQWIMTPLIVQSKQNENPQRLKCNQHIELFHHLKQNPPLQLAEWAQIYQDKRMKDSEGLLEPTFFQMDQQTLFCQTKDLPDFFISSLHFIKQMVTIFGFETQWILMCPRLEREGERADWFIDALEKCSITYQVHFQDKKVSNPRLEIRFVDQLGREWPGPFIEMITNRSVSSQLMILSRSILGSLDRFIALLLEATKGNLPIWLAPEQIRICSVGGHSTPYARVVNEQCQQQGYRVGLDHQDEKLGKKIHAAEKEKIPYICIIGEIEEKKKMVTIRSPNIKRGDRIMALDTFLEMIKEECLVPEIEL
jgi:threonyl-tRNA synthetase